MLGSPKNEGIGASGWSAATPASVQQIITWPQRLAMLCIWLGAVGVVLATLPYKSFELDRHFVAKEVALHLSATLAALCALVGVTRLRITRIDSLLIAFLGLSALSGLWAPNWWNAARTFAISFSSVLLFWAASVAGRGRLRSPLFVGLTVAMLAGVATALAQAYGVVGDYASLSRAPGGTFGNRNFMAHLAVICAPMLIYLTIRARQRAWLGLLSIMAVSGALVLSRSRAAWLALIVGVVLCAPALLGLRSAARRLGAPARGGRVLVILAAAAVGILAALLLPNALEWKSDSPYLDSVRSVVNYKEGSGRGRVIQYKRSLGMALHHPVFGVGTGNWAVVYPSVAPSDDPSLASDGRTANPWPSSDWVAMISERGIPAFLCFAIAMIGLLLGAVHRWHTAGDALDERGAAIVLGATILVTLVVGSFDAVLSIAISSVFVWTIAGALVPRERSRTDIELSGFKRSVLMLATLCVGGIFTARSVLQGYAMALFESGSTSAMRRAVQLDPGDYRIQVKLASLAEHRGQCTSVRRYAGAAHALFPDAEQPVQMLRSCGVRVR